MMTEKTIFAERLVPGWYVFALVYGFIGMISIAYGAVLGAVFGWLLLIVGGLLVSVLIVVTSPVVRVDADSLSVGRARLPRAVIAEVAPLDAEEVRRARGPQADARNFMALRPSRSRVAVQVTLDDPTDPHPAWIITSKRTAELLAALR